MIIEGRPPQPRRVSNGYVQSEVAAVRRSQKQSDTRAYGKTGGPRTPKGTAICTQGHAYFTPGSCPRC